ncbi:MAG: hypothetical protein EP329_07500, partial [Deltaproteobacteria bacterium]
MRWLSVALAGLVCGLSACSHDVDAPGARVAVAVAPLDLPGLTDARYTLSVVADGEVVWTRTLDSSAYGDGSGSLSYVGTCDADAAQNTVQLVLDGLQVGAEWLTAGVDFANPAPAGAPVERAVPCAADTDTAVTFDLTVARAASQGFFDIGVTFQDIFCSAKLDCVTAGPGGDEPLTLLFDPLTGTREQTAVLALACTAGPDAPATYLHMDDVRVVCDDGTTYVVAPSDGPGNLDPPFPGPPNTTDLLFQAAVFRGVEPLAGAQKAYLNVALGLNAAAYGAHGTCAVTTKATATDAPLVGGLTPAGTTWPEVVWDVDLVSGGARACTRHALGGADGGVSIAYTGTDGDLFDVSFAAALGTVSRADVGTDPVYGDGRDGDLVVSAATFDPTSEVGGSLRTGTAADAYAVTATSVSATSLTTADPLEGLAAGDLVLVHFAQAEGADGVVGNWDIVAVASVSGTSIALDGTLDPARYTGGTSPTVVVQRVPQYENVTIGAGGTLTAAAWDPTRAPTTSLGVATGIVALAVHGTLSVEGNGVDVSERGF